LHPRATPHVGLCSPPPKALRRARRPEAEDEMDNHLEDVEYDGTGSLGRSYAFLAGLAVLWAVLGSPLAHLHHQRLVAHMLQHLLLSLCAAPLILLGAPRLWPRGIRWRVNPAVCWGVAMLVFVGWHLPSLFDLAWRSARWHLIEEASFFVSGLLFWWPVIQPWRSATTWPRWSMSLYLFLATLPCDVLSAFLAFSDRVVYPAYARAPGHVGMHALQDQVGAGALMWLCVTFAYGVPAAIIVLNELSPRHRRRDLRSAAEV
jgi:putative membrane protein